jgi:ABC-type multidrug transport system ATPase subunit
MPLYFQHVTLGSSSRTLIDDLTFTLEPGQIAAVRGPSKSGKSSLLLCAAGHLRPRRGQVVVGTDETHVHPPTWQELGLGPIPGLAPLFDTLTVREHLLFQARLYRVRGSRRRVEELIAQYELQEQTRIRIKDLDHFSAFRATLAITLVHRPQYLLLDEPDMGLSDAEWTAAWQMLQRLRRDGVGVLFTTVLSASTNEADIVVDIRNREVQRREPVDGHAH